MEDRIRTIVVDDENRIRRGIERLVTSCGEEFEVVGSYTSGVEMINSYEKDKLIFDLLITDIRMPGMDGLELIKEMKRLASFESVVISGFNDFKYVQTALREGALDYMMKPLIREDFRKQLGKIKDQILQKRAQQKTLKVLDSELHYVKQVNKLSELIRVQEMDLAELEWTKDLPKGVYFLMNISIEQNGMKEQVIQLNSEVENKIVGYLNSLEVDGMVQSWFWKGDETSFWVLLLNEAKKEINEMLVAKKLQNIIKSVNQISVTIALSREFYDLALIPTIRDELYSSLQFRFIYGGNQIYTVSSVEKNLGETGRLKETKELEIIITRIVDSLEQHKKEELFSLLNEFFYELKKLTAPKDIERNIQILAIKSINRLLKNPFAKEENMLVQEALLLTKRSSDFFTLKKNAMAWMEKVLANMKELKKHETSDPVGIAKKWIMNNLGNNITIDKIAKEVHMNPTYFCEYFKNQTGETILDYVTKTRIEKARELLLSSDLKIYDISQDVGYTDTKYFSKLFKKYYGEVPTKYKEKIKNPLS